jgi:hypothetical protein
MAIKLFISYSHDNDLHANKVLDLANFLRGQGYEVLIDQQVSAPAEGWANGVKKASARSFFYP